MDHDTHDPGEADEQRRTGWLSRPLLIGLAVLLVLGLAAGGVLAMTGGRTAGGPPPGTGATATTGASAPAGPSEPGGSASLEPSGPGSGSADPSGTTEPQQPVGSQDPTAPASSPAPVEQPPAEEEPRERETAAPVDLDETVELDTGLTLAVADLEAVEGEAQIPGEVAGPALRVTVSAENGGSEAVDLRFAVVNLYHGEELVPASPLLEPGGQPFPESVPAGGSVDGVYVFSVPVDARDSVTVEVDTTVDETVTLFEGPAPR